MKYVYKHKISGLYFHWNCEDTNILTLSSIFTEDDYCLLYQFYDYEKIPYIQELRKYKLHEIENRNNL